MAQQFSTYACDECKSRKIRCSRELLGCSQCLDNSRDCKYSRSGIIRRKRKRTRPQEAQNAEIRLSSDDNANVGGRTSTDTSVENRRSSLKGWDFSERQLLRDVGPRAREVDSFFPATNPLLPTGFAQFWQDAAFIEMAERMRGPGNPLFTFEQEASSWTEMFVEIMKKGQPHFTPVPPEIAIHLATQPEKIQQKAYLIIFYGIMLTELSSDMSCDESTKTKLRWNLWICLNDARLLLEPSDINIEALMLLAFHVQDFHTPSLCWMITSNACRMLQALGVNTHSLDDKTRTRRTFIFWFLNSVDKCLALMFGRPPVFPKIMYKCIPKPTFQHFAEFHPHTSSSNSLFGAHLMHQMCRLSEIMDDIWTCLFSEEDAAGPLRQTRRNLDEWYETTKKNLEASFLAEKPLLDASGQRSIELGIRRTELQYLYLTVLLSRRHHHRGQTSQDYSHGADDSDCVRSSRRMLYLLDSLVSDSRDVYNGIVWQLLFQPFTPFFALLGHIRMLAHAREHVRFSNETDDTEKEEAEAALVTKMKQSVDAMECLGIFLEKMIPRHPLAEKLCGIASQHMSIAHRLMGASGQSQTGRETQGIAVERNRATAPMTSTSTGTSVVSPQTPLEQHTPTQFSLHSQWLDSIAKESDVFNVSNMVESSDSDFGLGGFDWFEWGNNINISNSCESGQYANSTST